jgi:hypothetical protein
MRTGIVGAALVAVMAIVSGCETMTQGGGSADADPEESYAASIPSGPYYYEYQHEGRYYIIGRPITAVEFEDTHEVPFTRTMVGAGPKGETVVLEVDKEDPTLADFLWEQFKEKHLYYAEVEADGKIYVVGSPESHQKFLSTKKLDNSKPIPETGPEGKPVVVETDPDNPHLAPRLESEFKERHAS